MATSTSGDTGSLPSEAEKAFKMEVSPGAVEQIRNLLKDQKPDMAVRVFVQVGMGGGCCGGSAPQFGMAFDRPKNNDHVIEMDSVRFVVDPYSQEFLNGANVDFVTLGEESGFKITNPHLPDADPSSGGGCGCGSGGCGSEGGGCSCGG